MSSLTEAEYSARAEPELQALLEALDEVGDELDAELASDILTVEFADGARFVINSHRAARQIWMAAEKKAWHFDFDPKDERWIANKTGEELWTVLEAALKRKLGETTALARSS